MNKSQLIEALAKEENLPLKKAEEIVNTVFGDMETALIDGQRVEIRGFGRFKVKKKRARTARNPRTNQYIQVEEGFKPVFEASKELRNKVNAAAGF